MNPAASIDALLDALADRITKRLEASTIARNRPKSQQLLNVKEAAEYLGRTVQSVRHLIAQNAIPVVRADRRVQIHIGDLDRWIEANKTKDS